MMPVLVLKLNPEGNVGLMDQVVAVPLDNVGVLAVIAAPALYTAGLLEYDRPVGGILLEVCVEPTVTAI